MSRALYLCAPRGDEFQAWHRATCARLRIHPDTFDRWFAAETDISGENLTKLIETLGQPFMEAMYGLRVASAEEAEAMDRMRECLDMAEGAVKGLRAVLDGSEKS